MRFKFDAIHIILITLLILVLLGRFSGSHIQISDITLFVINGRHITLLTILVLGGIFWGIRFISSPFRDILLFILILWFISLFAGFIFAGVSQVLLLCIVLMLFLFLFGL